MRFALLNSRWLHTLLFVSVAPAASPDESDALSARPAVAEIEARIRSYPVQRRVADFPQIEDLTTPEAAYATCRRISAGDEIGAWRRVSTWSLAQRLPAGGQQSKVAASATRKSLSAEILQVFVFEETFAMVCARIPHRWKTIIDIRTFEREEGMWKNAGNDVVGSMARARERFSQFCLWQMTERNRRERAPVADLEARLRPFVEFLAQEGSDPRAFLLDALTKHRLVILGEVHNRPWYWALNSDLVRSPDFARCVGAVYLEFPFSDQVLLDRFLDAPTNDPEPVIEMLRNMFELGWPDQPTVEFCQAVWEVNQALPAEQRIRIVLVDMARPWKDIRLRQDWNRYRQNRDQLMAEGILRDLQVHSDDPRHGLFIVGYMHALKSVTLPDGTPMTTAGRQLSQALGASNVFTVFPHSPLLANRGDTDGRIALGLFESAFARLGNRPMAFRLGEGPFGREPFDASLDLNTGDSFAAAFDAYLYLGPLEEETMAHLIPGFYTDEFAREVDRRTRLMNGEGLDQVKGEYLERLRAAWWGRPRYHWRQLGPLNAWHYGSDWERKLCQAKLRDALTAAPEIQAAARSLFEAIRRADYTDPGPWQLFPSPDGGYKVHSDYPVWVDRVCRRLSQHPITRTELGAVSIRADGYPQLPYVLVLEDGSILKGTLPFEWNVHAQRWIGFEGLDWHRQEPKKSMADGDPETPIGCKTSTDQSAE